MKNNYWLNRIVKFKNNATKDEKAKALIAVDKSILNSLLYPAPDFSLLRTVSINIRHEPIPNSNSIKVSVYLISPESAVGVKRPPPPPPIGARRPTQPLPGKPK